MPHAVLKSSMPDEMQAELFEHLREHTLDEGRAWIEKKLGRSVAKSTLSDWRAWYQVQRDCDAFASDAEGIVAALKGANVDPATAAKVGQAVFLARAAKEGDAKTYATVASVVLRAAELEASQLAHREKMTVAQAGVQTRTKALQLAERKIEALEKRAAQLEEKNRLAVEAAKHAKNKLKTSMTPEERAALRDMMDEMILGKKKPATNAPSNAA